MILLPFIPAPVPPVAVKTGPTAGLTEDPEAFLSRHTDITEALAAGKSIRTIQSETGKGRNTVMKVRRMLA